MSEKKAIPAWQQAAANDPAPSKGEEPAESQAHEKPVKDQAQDVTATTPDLAASIIQPPFKPGDGSDADKRDQIRAFLRDSGVANENYEKKRAFLLGKDMPAHLIDEELKALTRLDAADFDSFKRRDTAQEPQQEETVQPPPPIITYPEFLANAHQSPPLITPTRILATTYVASAAAALTYAASTFLVKPMTAQLTDARHEFSEHSNNKIEELNKRLEKLVSQVPKNEEDDASSVSSDATGLFSKDTGTQTEQIESKVTILEPTATAKQSEKLSELEKQLSEILNGAQKEGRAAEERESNVKKLRHYLDSLSYGGTGLNVWSNAGGQYGWEQTEQKDKEKKDAIEELKKDIRGVKGVLLSAKRFPAAGRMSSAAPTYSRRGVDAPA